MFQKKPPLSNLVTSAYISIRNLIDIIFSSKEYENSKGFANIQDFAAHWAIKNKQMVNVWKFDSVRMQNVLIHYSHVESKFQTFAICLFLPLIEL